MKIIITLAVTVFISACTSTAPLVAPRLEREFGGIELGKDFTPLSADVNNALKVDIKSIKPQQ